MCDMNIYDQKIKNTIAFYKCILCYNKSLQMLPEKRTKKPRQHKITFDDFIQRCAHFYDLFGNAPLKKQHSYKKNPTTNKQTKNMSNRILKSMT